MIVTVSHDLRLNPPRVRKSLEKCRSRERMGCCSGEGRLVSEASNTVKIAQRVLKPAVNSRFFIGADFRARAS